MRDDEVGSTVDARGAQLAAAEPAKLVDETRTSAEPLRAEVSSDAVEPRLSAPLQTRDPDRYTMLGEHGRGGLGRVLRAHDKELGRDIAVKELLERGNTTEVRFLREALITARLEHPGIVPVHEAGRWPDGTPFYAMKLVSGSPLKTLIDRAGSVEARLALVANVVAVADAIAYAHDRKIIHRDLKPSNVIVGEFGETVVIDWGLAKALDEPTTAIDSPYRGTQGHELTASGSVLGTPAYMAPEQYRGLADERTDIYAIGGILFHVLVGRSPHGDTAQPARDALGSTFPRDVPSDLVAIVRKAMAEEPAKRYPTARAFADDLRRYAQHQPVTARRYSLATRIALTFARHRAASLAIVGALVAIVATLVVSIIKISGERDAAETAQTVAESTKDEAVLQHARLLLKSDPTAALAAVQDYHGTDPIPRDLVDARAHGLGVAELIRTGHRREIQFLADTADEVLSAATDRSIRLTNRSGTSVVATDFGNVGRLAYARRHKLVIYTDSTSRIVALNLSTRRRQVLMADVIVDVAFSSDENALAIVTKQGSVTAWTVGDSLTLVKSLDVRGAYGVDLLDAGHMLVSTPPSLTEFSLSDESQRSVQIQDVTSVAHHNELLAVSDSEGSVHFVDSPRMTTKRSVKACPDSAAMDIALVTGSDDAVVACTSGDVNRVSLGDGSTSKLFSTHQYPLQIMTAGSTVLVRTGTTIFVHDLTGGLTSTLIGHASNINVISASWDGRTVLTGDGYGEVRRWRVLPSTIKVLRGTRMTTSNAEFSADSNHVAVSCSDKRIRLFDLRTGQAVESEPTASPIRTIRFSPNGEYLVGTAGSVMYAWSSIDLRLIDKLTSHQEPIRDYTFIEGGRSVVTASEDGRLTRWDPLRGSHDDLFSSKLPLEAVDHGVDDALATRDSAGVIWLLRSGQQPVVLRESNDDIVQRIIFSESGRVLAYGTREGHVAFINIATLEKAETSIDSSIRALALSSDGSRLVVASDEGPIRVIERATLHASSFDIAGLTTMYSPGCSLLSITDREGGLWIVSNDFRRWTYAVDHFGEKASFARFSPDLSWLLSTGTDGGLVVRQLKPNTRN